MSDETTPQATPAVPAPPPDGHPPLTGDVVVCDRLARRGQAFLPHVFTTIRTTIGAVAVVISHAFRHRDTVQYPDEIIYLPPRYRGRIILARDPDGGERCVACYLCAVACPVDCIALQATEDENGRRYPEWFRINFSRCIFCGYCEDACPTYAIQLTPDVEMSEYARANMVYEKEDLLIAGPGEYHGYNFYHVAGLAIGGKGKGEAEDEAPPTDLHDLLP
jgi:NADH-quinone oxidoreductase subunit I